jgi:hypothetical protein
MPKQKYNPEQIYINFIESDFTEITPFLRAKYGKKADKSGQLLRLTKGFAEKKASLWEEKKEKVVKNSLNNAGDNQAIKDMIDKSFEGEKKALDLLLEKLDKGEVGKITLVMEKDGKTVKQKKIGYRPLYIREIREVIDALRIQQSKPNNISKGETDLNLKEPPKAEVEII